DAGASVPTDPARASPDLTITNGIVACTLDRDGSIASLRRTGAKAELVAAGRALNELMLYEDRPKHWDAWDIDAEYEQTGTRLLAQHVRVRETGPLRACIEARYDEPGRFSIVQEYILV